VADRFFDALADGRGVVAQRRGALERVGLPMDDWRSTLARLREVETRLVAVLDGLELTALVTSIPGLSAVGAAVILAETGGFATARSVVKHAGLNPAENTSASFRGQTRVSHRGRPALRAAAWRAVWGALPHNPGSGRQVHPPDHPRTRPARPRASPRRLRRHAAALAARHRHQAATLQPCHRHRRRGRRPPTR
jgi:transposase